MGCLTKPETSIGSSCSNQWLPNTAVNTTQGSLPQLAWSGVVLLPLLTSGCFFYPREVEYYDSECDIHARRLVLKNELMQQHCYTNSLDPNGTGCIAFIAAVSAGSAIVSGSIVVVGNTVYWLEKKGKCMLKSNGS